MQRQLVKWYALSNYTSVDERYRADSLRYVLTITIPMLAFALVAKIISIIVLGVWNDAVSHAEHYYTAILLFGTVLTQVLSAILLGRGLLTLASYLAIVSIWLAFTIAAAYSGVLVLMGGFVGLVVIAAVLFGTQALVGFVGANLMVITLFFAVGEPVSRIPKPDSIGLILYYAVSQGVFLMVPALLLVRVSQTTQRLRDQTQSATRALRSQNAVLLKEIMDRHTAEADLLENQSRLQLALESAKLTTWRLDVASHEVILDDAWILNLPDQSRHLRFAEFIGLIHPEDQADTESLYLNVLDAKKTGTNPSSLLQKECRLRFPDGRYRWVAISGRAIYTTGGLLTRITGVIQDIEGRKTAEAEQTARHVAEEQARSLWDFLNMISHDLKTPLSVIRSNLYLIDRVSDIQKQQEWLRQIEKQTIYLEHFIQETLVMSRLENTDRLTFQLFDLATAVREIVSNLQPKIERKQQTLNLTIAPDMRPILGSYVELSRAMINLVENAINYTPENGQITLACGEEPARFLIEVSDTGIGIAPEDLPKIFDRFHRSMAAIAIEPMGSGLGLALVRRIVDMHHGSIEVQSVVGSGTTFRIRLPRLVTEE